MSQLIMSFECMKTSCSAVCKEYRVALILENLFLVLLCLERFYSVRVGCRAHIKPIDLYVLIGN